MTLSPSILSEQSIKTSFYEPFTRFGKHSTGINTNPFKKPLMANTGAVIIFEDNYVKPFYIKTIKDIQTLKIQFIKVIL